MRNQLAFIDEFGNFGYKFDSPGVSTHFIVTAIILDKTELSNNELILKEIAQKEFQGGEIKSSTVSKDDIKRIKVLEMLQSVCYHVFSVVIDKRKIFSEGLQYKKSFYKFLHSLVDRELFKTFPDIKIVSDEHGSKEFMEGFIKYIEKNHKPDLFSQGEFKFSNSKSELSVQVADFITGTLGFCYDEKKKSENSEHFLEILQDKIIEIKKWPHDYFPYTYEPLKDFKEFDEVISNLGKNLANQFLKEKDGKDTPSIKDQVNCLRYLLFFFININPSAYIPTRELMDHINGWRSTDISIHYFRSKVIAKLRDWGVILSSCPLGYKLPSNTTDLYDYVNHSNTYIQPMIARLMKCRDRVKMATKNDIDILDHKEFLYLKQLIQD